LGVKPHTPLVFTTMQPTIPGPKNNWDEEDSRAFLDFGRYFIPERETQIGIICDLVEAAPPVGWVVELCCGEGLLAGALLERLPGCTVQAFDGSPTMLEQAQARLARFGSRFQPMLFDLADDSWRALPWLVQAVVSSLAIHHLDGAQKQRLYQDMARLLVPGGRLVIADVIQPVDEASNAIAARAWDEAVRQRALELDGHMGAFDYFQRERWNIYAHPDPLMDRPSPLLDQLKWLEQAGLVNIDVYWLKAGHAIFGGQRPA
jgi:tRNA (cmo5U34)-methyltransferase